RGVEDIGADVFAYLRQPRGARLHDGPCDGVGVDEVGAEFGEHGRDRGFAGADAPGEPDVQHARGSPLLSARGRSPGADPPGRPRRATRRGAVPGHTSAARSPRRPARARTRLAYHAPVPTE